MQPAVYIVCDKRHGTLYTGVTSHLARRGWEHRTGALAGFTRRYGLKLLVWYEVYPTMEDAIMRENRIKAWKRGWKIKLIERMNRRGGICTRTSTAEPAESAQGMPAFAGMTMEGAGAIRPRPAFHCPCPV